MIFALKKNVSVPKVFIEQLADSDIQGLSMFATIPRAAVSTPHHKPLCRHSPLLKCGYGKSIFQLPQSKI
jgi:hypothetical protein